MKSRTSCSRCHSHRHTENLGYRKQDMQRRQPMTYAHETVLCIVPLR